jgi:hypothetical protein
MLARVPLLLAIIGLLPRAQSQTTVGYELFAQTDTVYLFDLLSSDRWIDGKPMVLFRNFAYPEANSPTHDIEHHYLYSLLYSDQKFSSELVLEEPFDTGPIITGDFDEDDNIEILGRSSHYNGEGTQIFIMEYSGGQWKEYKEIIPYYIETLFTVDIFDDSGDDFVFVYLNDTTGIYDNESPTTSLIFGNWDGERLSLTVDSTFHYSLQALDASYGDKTSLYIYEAQFDSAFLTADGPRQFGALVKYNFDRESGKIEKLYQAECPSFDWGLTGDNEASVFASDTLIIILNGAAMQWFKDDGQALTLFLIQWAPFQCHYPTLVDIDGDNEDDLICAEPIISDSLVQDPNWVIKAYKFKK